MLKYPRPSKKMQKNNSNSNSKKRKRMSFDILEELLNEDLEYQDYWEEIIHPPPKKQVLPPGLRDKKSDEESKVRDDKELSLEPPTRLIRQATLLGPCKHCGIMTQESCHPYYKHFHYDCYVDEREDDFFSFHFEGVTSNWLVDYLEEIDYWDKVINPIPTKPVLPPALEKKNKIEKLKRLYHGNTIFNFF